ncbi:hypothetical protein [Burkholderia catarinensis]|uniref:hypothetical protein n=1 Tax=Burkholderia catarinensis TaxID=1108140 RepID=UPI002687DF1F|nr:hypothetical protein [Burkholderia catarinensis]
MFHIMSASSPSQPGTPLERGLNDPGQLLFASGDILLRISRSLLERTLVGQLNHPLESPLPFELGFRWRDTPP